MKPDRFLKTYARAALLVFESRIAYYQNPNAETGKRLLRATAIRERWMRMQARVPRGASHG